MKLKQYLLCIIAITTIGIISITAVGCESRDDGTYHIGVFVPGYVEGSPTYELMVNGATRAAEEREDLTITVVEGGPNQSGWEESVMTMAANRSYDLIMSSNPSLPDIAARVAEQVPQQRFLLLDAEISGNPAIAATAYNHREQAFLNGYFAALLSQSELPSAQDGVRLGLVAGQEFPVMNNVIRTGFMEGARAAAPEASLDFRVVGGWNDPGKAAELARSMISGGVDVILTIAGGGNQGVITTAQEQGAYVTWFDASGYDFAPGVVMGSTVVRQDTAAYVGAVAAANGELHYGETIVYGVREGYVGFDTQHPAFQEHVPQEFQQKIIDIEQSILHGEINLPMN
ncbi:MAG: BMP family ABC transporter substrate-binding protein [Spirochaeta sp.]